MRTITIAFPDSVDLNEQEAKTVFAAKLYELGKLSLGEAANLAGYPKETFMEMLGNYGVSFFNYPPSDLDEDLKHAANHSF